MEQETPAPGTPSGAPVTPPPPSTSPAHDPTLMGILAYLGPLVLIPYFVAKEQPGVRFHVKQGLVLFVIEVLMWLVGMLTIMLMPVVGIVNLGTFVLAIIGIVNVIQRKEQELPIVGKYASHFNNI